MKVTIAHKLYLISCTRGRILSIH